MGIMPTHPTVWGIPDTSQHGRKSELPNQWAWWRHNLCGLGLPNASVKGKNQK